MSGWGYSMGKKAQKDAKKSRVHIPKDEDKKAPSWIPIILLFLTRILSPVAVILLIRKLLYHYRKRERDYYRNYAAVIGNRDTVDIRELAFTVGKPQPQVIRDLQNMINKGYINQDAYIDHSKNMLILKNVEAESAEKAPEPEVHEEVRKDVHEEVHEDVHEEIREEVRGKSSQKKTPPKQDAVWQEDEFEEKLRAIRTLNDQIDDVEVSSRIDRIGSLTASIFAFVRQNPDRAGDVRKFMNYYLPTTLKLLKSYALMEKQSYQGENIVASRKKIEDILDVLITAFEQQQDRLFRTEAMDIEADIDVLETMMQSDGLITPKGLDLHAVYGKD